MRDTNTSDNEWYSQLTSVGIAVGNECGNKRGVVELDQLVGAVDTDDRLVLLQSKFRSLIISVKHKTSISYQCLSVCLITFRTSNVQCKTPSVFLEWIYASWPNTWSLARANVHPRADSVKGGEQLGALATWVSEHKNEQKRRLVWQLSTAFHCHCVHYTLLTRSPNSLPSPFFLPLRRTTPSRSVTTADSNPSTLIKERNEKGTDYVSNLVAIL